MEINFDGQRFLAWVAYHMIRFLDLGVPAFHRELIGALGWSRVAMCAPRGHSKSTYCSFFYPMYQLLEIPGVQIVLVGSSYSNAEGWLCKIRDELETSETIRDWYGEVKGRTWNTNDIVLRNGSRCIAVGSGAKFRGIRPNIILCDDLEDDELVMSGERMLQFDDWFWNALMQTLKGGAGQAIVIGTILHPESFLARLVRYGRHGWKRKFFQAIKKDGTALWPEMYSLEKLRDIRLEMGDYGFNQEYMNDPVPNERRVFRDNWFKYYDKIPEGSIRFTAVDLAIEQKKKNDYTAIVTVALDSDENMYIEDIVRKKMSPLETMDYIFGVYDLYKPHVIGVESIGFQKMFKTELEKEMMFRRSYPNIEELKSGGRRKHLRIEALQPRFERGKIFMKKGMVDLEMELKRFPSPRCHDDIIDALAYILDIMRPANIKMESMNPRCFLAMIERDRGGSSKVWGNHNLRGR